jgi:NAD dependent epimerase/dehydratase
MIDSISKKDFILLSGADGFIGSHLCERLVIEGFNVRVISMYNSFGSWGWLDHLPENIKSRIDVRLGDIRDPTWVRDTMKGCSKVLHLAALIAIPYSYVAPSSYIETNVRGTLNMLQAAKDLGVERFIQTSTSEVYGTAVEVPMNESHRLQGQSPYAASKIAADQLAYSYFSSFNLPVVIVRPFNTYGPRQSARAVIPSIATQILSGSRKINLGSTSPTRDFNFVADTVSGFLAALTSNVGLGEVINIGSGFEVSIGRVAQKIIEITNQDVEIIVDEKRVRPLNSEVERLLADNSKAAKLFGWSPAYSGEVGLELGLRETIKWLALPANLALYKSQIYNV